MTFFSNLFRRITNWRRPKPPTTIEDRLLWLLRPYLSTLEDLLLWKNPPFSFGLLLFANALVWLIGISGIPVLGLVGMGLTGAAVLDAAASAGRRRLRAPAPRSAPPPAPRLHAAAARASHCLSSAYLYLRDLRQENHSKFCFLVSASVAALWLLSRIGGTLLLHGALSAALLAPLAPELHTSIVAALNNHAESDGEMEGFLPEMSPLALHELQQAGDQPRQLPSFTADLSLPSDVGAALRYAAGEASSSEDEGDGGDAGRRLLTPDPPSTDTTDSDSEFLLKDKSKKSSSSIAGNTRWFSPLNLTPSAPPQKDSDSDEFELIDKDDL